MVHDRARVEAEVLPRYFNHASFASLRRQLNYFSFTRLGKGRQRGATYCNEGVVELDDILLLRRRPSGANAGPRAPSPPKEQTEVQPPEEQLNAQSVWTDTSAMATANHVVPFVHLAPSKPKRKATDAAATETDSRNSLRKKSRFFKRSSPPPMISPLSSTANSEDELAPPQVILDLTVPSARIGRSQFHEWKLNPICGAFDDNTAYDDGNEEPSASPSKIRTLWQDAKLCFPFRRERLRDLDLCNNMA